MGRGRVRPRDAIPVALALIALLASPSDAYDRPGRTQLVTLAHDGAQASPVSLGRCIQHGGDMSADGRYITFHSEASNIVPGDTNASCDVFVRDMQRDEVKRVSVAGNGAQGVGACATGGTGSSFPSISNNGRYVAFESCATNLVGGDTNLSSDVFVHDRKGGTTRRVSLGAGGAQTPPATWSGFPDVGNRGDVVFTSTASNLVADDDNGAIDVFMHTKEAGTSRVSVSGSGSEGNGASEDPTMTPDGRLIVFRSTADNLVDDDINRSPDVFVRDVVEGSTELVSTASDGTQGNGRSLSRAAYFGPSISASGRFVSFTSQATNLVPNDSNLIFDDAFIHDRQTGRTERVSVTSFGEQGSFSSAAGAIGQTGRYVPLSSINDSFSSGPDDDSGAPFGDGDIYLYDRAVGSLTWVSVAPDGSESRNGEGTPSFMAVMSTDAKGRHVSFLSDASNLVEGDENDWGDVFVRDLGAELGVGELEDPGSRPDPGPEEEICIAAGVCIPPLGVVTSADRSGDPLPGQMRPAHGGDLIEASVAFRPQHNDLFVVEELGYMPSLSLSTGTSLGTDRSVLYGLRFTVEDRRYEVRASPIADGTFGLFDCTDGPTCSKIAPLRGGYGTTGMRVVFSIPLGEIRLSRGGRLGDLEAFSALGTYHGGAIAILDRIEIGCEEGRVVRGCG